MKRREAKKVGLKKYTDCKPCIKGHGSIRWVVDGQCVVCQGIKSNKASKKKYKLNRVKILAELSIKRDNKEYKEKQKIAYKKWYLKNKESQLKKISDYKKANKHKVNCWCGRRYVNIKSLTPSLSSVDRKKMENLYLEAKGLFLSTGVKYHVDHIAPLSKGGAHHWVNMEIITAHDNLVKHKNWDGVSGVLFSDFMAYA